MRELPMVMEPDASVCRGSFPAGQVAQALAWAVKRNIPFADALRTIEQPRYPVWLIVVCFLVFWPLLIYLHLVTRARRRFYRRLDKAIRVLETGLPLTVALKTHLHRELPSWYVQAVEDADMKKTSLETVLPVLAERIRHDAEFRRFHGYIFHRLFWYSIPFVILTLGQMIFIVPKFAKIFWEMSAGEPLPMLTQLIMGVSNWLLTHTVWMLLVTVPVLLGLLIAYRIPYTRSRLADLCAILHVPYIGRHVRLLRLLNICQGMIAHLQTGADVLAAAHWCESTCPGFWARRRLARFCRQLEEGMPWHEAWRAMRLSSHLDNWLVDNGAWRETPVAALQSVVEHTHDELRHRVRLLRTWGDPLIVVMYAILIGSVAVGLWMPLIKMTETMAA